MSVCAVVNCVAGPEASLRPHFCTLKRKRCQQLLNAQCVQSGCKWTTKLWFLVNMELAKRRVHVCLLISELILCFQLLACALRTMHLLRGCGILIKRVRVLETLI